MYKQQYTLYTNIYEKPIYIVTRVNRRLLPEKVFKKALKPRQYAPAIFRKTVAKGQQKYTRKGIQKGL